jgi:hypothetical protein
MISLRFFVFQGETFRRQSFAKLSLSLKEIKDLDMSLAT